MAQTSHKLKVLSSRQHINAAKQINVEKLQTMDEMKFELIKDNKIKQSLYHIGTIADTTGEQNTAMNDRFEYLPNEILSFPLSRRINIFNKEL